MHRSFKILGWVVTLPILFVLVVGTALLLDRKPLVAEHHRITSSERAWARRWFFEQRARAHRGGSVTLRLSEHDATLLANALIDKIGEGQAEVRLEEGRALLTASLALPWGPEGSFANLKLALVEGQPLPRIESARVAGLPIPSALIQRLAERGLTAVDRTQSFRKVDLKPAEAQVTYEWHPNLLEQIGSGLVDEADLPNVLRYQAHLQERVGKDPRRRVALADLLETLLAKAYKQPETADPVAENRAVILALAAYVNGRTVHDPDSASEDESATKPRMVLLRRRQDLGQHFMTSAALVAQGDDTLSSLIGWYKEMSDANGGSGFSFVDMAANRSGIRFAKLATADRAQARHIQQLASKGLTEDDFMPSIEGLPEGMSRDVFQATYGSGPHPDYQRLIASIDRSIDARRLYRKDSQ